MARLSQDLKRIKIRRLRIERSLRAYEIEIDRLRQELSELETAERVLQRLAASPQEFEELDEAHNDVATSELPELAHEGYTIGDLALAVLREAGDEGFTSTEILGILRESTVPNLVRTSLSPPLSRLKQKGVIELVGDKWKIVPEKDPPEGATSGGS